MAEKPPDSGSSAGEKHLVNDRHQRRMARRVQANRKAIRTQVTA
jgi:hypothetical protein